MIVTCHCAQYAGAALNKWKNSARFALFLECPPVTEFLEMSIDRVANKSGSFLEVLKNLYVINLIYDNNERARKTHIDHPSIVRQHNGSFCCEVKQLYLHIYKFVF